jgi:hypothetical protein
LERKMADRNRKDEQPAPKTSKPAPTEQPDDGIEQNPDPDSQKSGASRPRGHTEEPDRTL